MSLSNEPCFSQSLSLSHCLSLYISRPLSLGPLGPLGFMTLLLALPCHSIAPLSNKFKYGPCLCFFNLSGLEPLLGDLREPLLTEVHWAGPRCPDFRSKSSQHQGMPPPRQSGNACNHRLLVLRPLLASNIVQEGIQSCRLDGPHWSALLPGVKVSTQGPIQRNSIWSRHFIRAQFSRARVCRGRRWRRLDLAPICEHLR